jgi:CubicO group peptidase (beta-lactamase class C family)
MSRASLFAMQRAVALAVRRGGVWNGAPVLSEKWIQEAWTPRTLSPFSGDDYGYGWFISSTAGRKLISARGYGGQMIDIEPARSDGYVGELRNLLANEIIPAAG